VIDDRERRIIWTFWIVAAPFLCGAIALVLSLQLGADWIKTVAAVVFATGVSFIPTAVLLAILDDRLSRWRQELDRKEKDRELQMFAILKEGGTIHPADELDMRVLSRLVLAGYAKRDGARFVSNG